MKKILSFKFMAVALLTIVCGFCFTGCSYCAHDLEVITESKQSTCTQHGEAYVYKCKKCGAYFGWSEESGLHKIDSADTPDSLPLAAHEVCGNTKIKPKPNITAAASLFDFSVTDTCGVCEKEFEIAGMNLVPQCIPGLSSDAFESQLKQNGEGAYFTAITFAAGQNADAAIVIDAVKSDEWEIRNTHKKPVALPCTASEKRLAMQIIRNTSNVGITVSYSINGTDFNHVEIPAGGFGAVNSDCTMKKESVCAMQYLKIKADGADTLASDITVEMTGYIVIPGKIKDILKNIVVESAPVKTQYVTGEKFSADGLIIYANYKDGALFKRLSKDEYTVNIEGKALTKQDTKALVSYFGKTVSVPITVREKEEK